MQPASISLEAKAPAVVDLPEELLIEIIKAVAGSRTWTGSDYSHRDEVVRSLSYLSRTNRLFHRLVAEHLYRVYDDVPQPYLFLRTMVQQPHLASYLKEVNLTRPYKYLRTDYRYSLGAVKTSISQDDENIKQALGEEYWTTLERHFPNPADYDLMRQYENEKVFFMSSWDQICDARRKFDVTKDLINAGILTLASNAYILAMNLLDTHGRNCLQRLELVKALTAHNAPRKIHTICINSQEPVYWETDMMALVQLSSVLRWDSLRSLQIDRLFEPCLSSGADADLLHIAIPTASNLIEEMTLRGHSACMEMIAVLVKSSRGLKRFMLHYGCKNADMFDGMADWSGEVGTMPIIDALKCQKDSLEEIYLCWMRRIYRLMCKSDNEWSSLFPELTKFEKLKRLTCPWVSLLNEDQSLMCETIPPNLLSLQLLKFDPAFYVAFFQGMAVSMSTFTHSLCEVRVLVPEDGEYETGILEECRVASERAGVEFFQEYHPGFGMKPLYLRDLSYADEVESHSDSDPDEFES